MRQVLGSHAQTAHVWAQNNQERGRASDGRMFFEHGILYSYGYHFAIASHAKTLKGEPAILFTTAGYSVSTGKHISLTRQAIRKDANVFHVPNPRPSNQEDNLKKMDQELDSLLRQYAAPRIRQTTRDKIAGQIAHLIKSRNYYGENFIKKYKRVEMPENIGELAAKLEKARVAKAKAEAKAREKALEGERVEAERLLGMPRQEWATIWRDNNEGRYRDETRYISCRRVVSQYVQDVHGVLLRPKGDKIIQTSAGAEFPTTHAKKAFAFIRKIKEAGTTWEKNGHTIHLGHYQIDSIDKAGNVKAGCHFVKWDEIELCARKLDLFP